MFYEIIYETGDHSVAYYEDDTEAISAISEHHRRAKAGEKAQASNDAMGPAIRVVKVLKYDEHPVTFGESQAVPVSDISAAVEEAINKHRVGDLVSVPEIAAAIRAVTIPTVDSAPHDSNYKMQEVDELTGWEGESNAA